ncbi:TROVE domain-containing protein [Phytohabitans houttuyneae]|uniref:RNA-binding protein n=1 Tax=Phytohabitans houttuyneae TaxID=1076126 RepID=A0A6V8KEV5_9ACTN|nr:TROVE domain-containing protein [Phytohabitans houttuyneae]GFJ80991.1 RNA-binding protein [Phytohabitans houttuyneae]
MAKFNTTRTRAAAGNGPLAAEKTPSLRTYEGAPGFARDVKSELFLLAVANFVGEDTFYEKAGSRDGRFAGLVRQVAYADVDWLTAFLRWLRTDANLRSAPIVAAAEAVKARLDAGVHGGNRQLVTAVMARADEPGEFLAYWRSRFGRTVPLPVKNGLRDAVVRLYSERSLLKYDTGARGYRFADLIDLYRPAPKDERQSALFRHALDRRHHRADDVPAVLSMLRTRGELAALPVGERRAVLADPARLARAGMTWEALSGWLDGPMDKAAWEAMIPSMGIMALARNLRNFDEAGVSDQVAATVAARFADPAEVAKSRMFPFRWLAAYEQAPSPRWGHALDKALQASLSHLPAMPGRTLVLVDTSASMSSGGFSKHSKMTPVKAAAVFGVALAAKGERVDLHGFADGVFRHRVGKGASVIKEVAAFCKRIGEVGHGTQVAQSIRATFAGHDRVFVISDMQTMTGHHAGGVMQAVPRSVPLYGVNLGGYRPAAFDAGSPNRIEFGGLTDAMFRIVPLVEAGGDASWPWLAPQG